MSGTLELRSIGQIAVPVHDLERAVAFYRDTLGLRFYFNSRASPFSIAAACG